MDTLPDTSFVIFACLVSELLEIVIFLVMAATNLHMNRDYEAPDIKLI